MSLADLSLHRCVWRRTPSLLSWVRDAEFWSFLSLGCQLRHPDTTCSFRDVPLTSWSSMASYWNGHGSGGSGDKYSSCRPLGEFCNTLFLCHFSRPAITNGWKWEHAKALIRKGYGRYWALASFLAPAWASLHIYQVDPLVNQSQSLRGRPVELSITKVHQPVLDCPAMPISSPGWWK